MFLLLKPFSYFSRMKKSLQVLGLQPPTTKKAIKAKYLELVKLSHPDVAESKQLQSTFVEITEAYNYLSQRSEEEINHKEQLNTQSQSNGDPQVGPAPKRNEKERQQTYNYFNRRRYQTQNVENPKISLLKQFPELFVGFFIVFLFLCEWIYMASKKTVENHSTQENRTQVCVDHLDSFKNLNFRKRFTVQENRIVDLEKQI